MDKPSISSEKVKKKFLLFAHFAVRVLLILLIMLCIGLILIIIFSWLMLSCTAYSCSNAAAFPMALSIAIALSTLLGSVMLRYIAKIHWPASIAAPLIGIVATISTAQVAISFYGENVLGYPSLIIIGIFATLLVTLIFLFDNLKKWTYPVAALLFICSVFVLPIIVAETGQFIRTERNAQRVTQAAQTAPLDTYSPSYMPYDAKFVSADSRLYMQFKYELNYSTVNKFNPYGYLFNADTKTFQIIGTAHKQDLPNACEGQRADNCQKVGSTKHCPVYRSEVAAHSTYPATFYCVIEKTRLSLSGDATITNQEAIKVFDSLQPGISKLR